MDEFLPGDIALLVLRYLAGSGCEDTVMSMMRDLPFVKFYLPSQPPHLSTGDYLKLLSKPAFTGLSLVELLNDYAKSRLTVAQMVEKRNPGASPLRQYDSMMTQLKQLTDDLDKNQQVLPPVISPQTTLALLPLLVDIGVNTDAVEPIENVKYDVGVNTEPLANTHVDFGVNTDAVDPLENTKEIETQTEKEDNPKVSKKNSHNKLVNDLFGTDCSSSSEGEEPKAKRKKTESKKRKSTRNKSDDVFSVKSQKTTIPTTKKIVEKVGQKKKTPLSAQKKSQRSRRSDAVAAISKAVADNAIPLGRCLRSSPKLKAKQKSPMKSPIKELDIPSSSSPNQAASLLKENTISYPSEVILPFSSNGHNNFPSDQLPPTIPHVTITPPSEPPLPFNILPAPFGFPEPTPIKFRRDYNNQSQNTFSFITPSEMMSLVTPMKGPSNSTISPPSLPPTPRYMVQDYMDMDSNSVSNFRIFRNLSDGQLSQTDTLNTPFKAGPPPTPGKDFSYDERAPGTITISTLQPSQLGNAEVPLDKVTSPPIPPHVSISRNNNNFNVIVSKSKISENSQVPDSSPASTPVVSNQVSPINIEATAPIHVILNPIILTDQVKEVERPTPTPLPFKETNVDQPLTSTTISNGINTTFVSRVSPWQKEKSLPTSPVSSSPHSGQAKPNIIQKIPTAKRPIGFRGMTVLINGTRKCLVMSDETVILKNSENALKKFDQLSSPSPQNNSNIEQNKPSPAEMKNYLQQVDLNQFLRGIHNPT